jgi:hypothetical protein
VRGQATAGQTESADLAGAYFAQLEERFELAAEAVGGASDHDLEMAGLRVRLRCAGEPIKAALLPPFEHLAASNGGEAPELTISLFDTASSGIDAPSPSWEPLRAEPGTNPVVRLRSDSASVLAAAGSGALTAVRTEEGRATFHLTDAGRVPSSERAAPLRDALQLLMAARQRWMTHAGAVGRGGAGVLLVGRGGSGKSTLALSCALAGMEIVADDYVLLEAGERIAHAMQSTAKLTEDSVARLGVAVGALDSAGFESTLEGPAKALVDIRGIAAGGVSRQLAIRAIVAPVVSASQPAHIAGGDALGEGKPMVRPISAAEGLRAVAPSTIVQSGFAGGAALASLAQLVREVPSYALELRPEPTANAAAVDRLVGELG